MKDGQRHRGATRRARWSRVHDHVREPFYRSAYSLVLNTGATSILGFAYWILAARTYPSGDVGRNSALIAAMITLSNLSQLNLWSALGRFLPNAGHQTGTLVRNAYAACTAAAIVASVGFVSLAPSLSRQFHFLASSWSLKVGFCLGVVTWGIFALQDSVLTALRRAPWVPIENATFGVIKIVLLLAVAGTMSGFGIFASWTIPVALSLVPVNWLIFRRVIPAHRRKLGAHRVQPSAPLPSIGRYIALDYVGYVCLQASTTLLPVLVVGRLGPTQGALFYSAWLLSSSFDLLASNIGISLTVEGSHDPAHVGELVRRVFRRIVVAVGGISLLGLASAPLILFVFGSGYTSAATLLRLLLLGALPRAFNQITVAVARVQGRLPWVVAMQATTCVLVLGLTSLLIGRIGIEAVGIAWIAGQTTVAVVMIPQLRRWVRPAHPVSAPATDVPQNSLTSGQEQDS